MKACDLLDAELALDRLEARLGAEMPCHVRAFARAHAASTPSPPAPVVDRAALDTLEVAREHPILADRVLALARLLVPLAIEQDPRVAAVRANAVGWQHYTELMSERDVIARSRFGRPFVALSHLLHGVPAGPLPRDGTIERLAGWHEPDGIVVELADLRARWRSLAVAHGVAIDPVFVASDARPRAFVVEPRREVIVVVPSRIDTPYARFAALHELGHALVASLAPAGTPRTLDEAVASWTARAMESPADPWHSPLGAEARARRTSLAIMLATVEGGRVLSMIGALRRSDVSSEDSLQVPRVLVEDPGVQAAYVAAESLAGTIPADGFASWLGAERARIDRSSAL